MRGVEDDGADDGANRNARGGYRSSDWWSDTNVRSSRSRAVGTVEEIIEICRRNLNEDEMRGLVAWIAWRTERPMVMTRPELPPLEQLERVVADWLNEKQRLTVAAWLARRIALGQQPVP